METKKKSKNILKFILLSLLFLILAFALFISIRGLIRATRINHSPEVEINQPYENVAVIEGTRTPVQVTARSRGNPISSIEFFINGRLSGNKQEINDLVIGDWDWTPSTPGEYDLAFVAYDESGLLGSASRSVIVLAIADRDLDGIGDTEDNCPDTPGSILSSGCPVDDDFDSDGIPDDEDMCPDAFGSEAGDGCPLPFAPDADSDGTPDYLDRCPDESGLGMWEGCPEVAWVTDRDGDGIPDFMDGCPDWYGSPEGDGCPDASPLDSDGDGVSDSEDLCVDEPGTPESGGCPLEDDRDGDGIPDSEDDCPDEPGWEGADGCMVDSLIVDIDLDTVLDFEDRCPGERGCLELFGCPDPLDSDSDGVFDEDDSCPDEAGFAIFDGCPLRYFPEAALNLQNAFIPELSPFYGMTMEALEEDASGLYTLEGHLPGYSGRGGTGFFYDRDGDGTEDFNDDCPDEWGPIRYGGCLPEGDSDGDGVPDERDACPGITGYWGSPNGCLPTSDHVLTLEVEFFLVRAGPGFIGGYCYIPHPHYTFTYFTRIPPQPDYYQDLYRLLPIHVTEFDLASFQPKAKIDVPANGELSIILSCYGQPDDVSLPASHLGDIIRTHNASEWDSMSRFAGAEGRDSYLIVWYRICVDSCRD